MSRPTFRPRPLDITKKLPIVKSIRDLDNDEGVAVTRNVQNSHVLLDTENDLVLPPLQRKGGSEIPTPQFIPVDSYEKDYSQTFVQPPSYLRGRGARNEGTEFVEYDLDDEDEDWVQQFNNERKILSPERFEWMLYKLELLDYKARERAGSLPPVLGIPVPVLLQREAAIEVLRNQNTRVAVLSAVFDYWKNKREKWQKPVLRRLQPPPPVNDTNPFNVFRPREKVHRPHTRRMQRRENDVQSFEKLRQIRRNLDQARTLILTVQKREEKKRDLMECETSMQKLQLKYKYESRSDEDFSMINTALLSPYPRKLVFQKRNDMPGEQSAFSYGMPDQMNGHANIDLMADGIQNEKVNDQLRRKRKRRRLPQPRGRPVRKTLDTDPALLFTRPLDTRELTAAGILPEFESSPTKGPNSTPYNCRARWGRGGRIICDRWNPLTRTPIGVNSTFGHFQTRPRSPARMNMDNTQNSLQGNSSVPLGANHHATPKPL